MEQLVERFQSLQEAQNGFLNRLRDFKASSDPSVLPDLAEADRLDEELQSIVKDLGDAETIPSTTRRGRAREALQFAVPVSATSAVAEANLPNTEEPGPEDPRIKRRGTVLVPYAIGAPRRSGVVGFTVSDKDSLTDIPNSVLPPPTFSEVMKNAITNEIPSSIMSSDEELSVVGRGTPILSPGDMVSQQQLSLSPQSQPESPLSLVELSSVAESETDKLPADRKFAPTIVSLLADDPIEPPVSKGNDNEGVNSNAAPQPPAVEKDSQDSAPTPSLITSSEISSTDSTPALTAPPEFQIYTPKGRLGIRLPVGARSPLAESNRRRSSLASESQSEETIHKYWQSVSKTRKKFELISALVEEIASKQMQYIADGERLRVRTCLSGQYLFDRAGRLETSARRIQSWWRRRRRSSAKGDTKQDVSAGLVTKGVSAATKEISMGVTEQEDQSAGPAVAKEMAAPVSQPPVNVLAPPSSVDMASLGALETADRRDRLRKRRQLQQMEEMKEDFTPPVEPPPVAANLPPASTWMQSVLGPLQDAFG